MCYTGFTFTNGEGLKVGTRRRTRGKRQTTNGIRRRLSQGSFREHVGGGGGEGGNSHSTWIKERRLFMSGIRLR